MIKLRNRHIIVKLLPLPELPLNLIAVDVGKTWAKDQLEALVTHVGPDVDEIGVGDKVLIAGAAGRWIDAGVVDSADRDSTYRFLGESDILGVIESQKQEALA
jgi:hypothetical protein